MEETESNTDAKIHVHGKVNAEMPILDLPGGLVVKNPPAGVEDTVQV